MAETSEAATINETEQLFCEGRSRDMVAAL